MHGLRRGEDGEACLSEQRGRRSQSWVLELRWYGVRMPLLRLGEDGVGGEA